MGIQPPQTRNQIRTLALVPGPLPKQLARVEPAVVIEAKPISRASDRLDFEPDDPTESEVAQWNAFIQHEIGWRRHLLTMVDGHGRILDPERGKHLRGQLYEIERGLRWDVTWPWNETHEPLPPAVSLALWSDILIERENERRNACFASAELVWLKLQNDTTLTTTQRATLLERCRRALDGTRPRMGCSLPESWKPRRNRPGRAFRQAAKAARFPKHWDY